MKIVTSTYHKIDSLFIYWAIQIAFELSEVISELEWLFRFWLRIVFEKYRTPLKTMKITNVLIYSLTWKIDHKLLLLWLERTFLFGWYSSALLSIFPFPLCYPSLPYVSFCLSNQWKAFFTGVGRFVRPHLLNSNFYWIPILNWPPFGLNWFIYASLCSDWGTLSFWLFFCKRDFVAHF